MTAETPTPPAVPTAITPISGAYLPGTTASQNREPELVTAVRELVASGHDRRSAAQELADRPWVRTDVQAARIYWLQQMRQFEWDDYVGIHILRIIEDVLFGLPRSGTPV